MEKYVTVGIAGHVDHGKTSLVRCLTGFDTDRLEAEKRRGLSIEAGIAPFELESGTQIALVDVPGHTDFLKNTAEAWAGQRVGINLHKVPIKDVQRGMALAKPGTVKSSYLLNVDLRVLPGTAKPIKNRQRVKLYLGTSVTSSLVILMDKEQLEPGETGLAQLRLMKPVAALPGDPFVVCPLNIQTTVAGGKVLEVPHQKYRQGKAAMMISSIEALKRRNLRDYVRHALKSSPYHLLRVSELAQNTGFPLMEMEVFGFRNSPSSSPKIGKG